MLGSASKSLAKKLNYIKPFFVADVANANGADNNFIELNDELKISNFDF